MNKLLCAALLSATSFGVSAAPMLIDDYSADDLVVDTSVGCLAGAVEGTGCFSYADDSGILGGQREIYADLVTSTLGINDVELVIEADVLSFNVGAGSSGTGIITYDGMDGDHAVDTTGLGGYDLTDSGTNTAFAFDVLFSDAGFAFDINVWSGAGVLTTASFVSLGAASPVTRIIPFSDPAFGGFDFSDLGALQFVIDPAAGFTSLDLALDDTRTIPEPTTVALLSIGLFSLGFARRRLAHA